MPTMHSPPGPLTIIDGREYRYFAGTGYLCLQGRPELIRAACAATEQFGLGSATSRSGNGDTPPTLDAERRAAAWCAQEAAFVFASGFVGASIVCRMFAGKFSRVLIDERAHYAITEAAPLLGVRPIFFRHRDAQHVRELAGGEPALLLSDGMFAATGAIAPVLDFVYALRDSGGAIYLDDAHAFGVLGERGRGTFEFAGCDDHWNRTLPDDGRNDVKLYSTATLSKAIGAYGGIAAGSSEFIAQLKQSTWYAGSSAPIPAAMAAANAAFELLERDPSIRASLARNVTYLKSKLAALGLPIDATPAPIIPLVLETAAKMQHVHDELKRQGIIIGHFPRYAGLGENGALRIAVLANHTPAMLDELADALARLL